MKKGILFVLLLAALLFTACDKKTSSTESSDAAGAQQSADAAKADNAKADAKPAESAANTEQKALVLEINDKPEGKFIKNDVAADGTYQNEELIDGMIVLGTSKIAPIADGQDNVRVYINKSADNAYELNVEQDSDLTAKLTYPTYKATYKTGHNEDMRENTDYVILTDKNSFIMHVSVPADFAEDNAGMINGLVNGMNLVEK